MEKDFKVKNKKLIKYTGNDEIVHIPEGIEKVERNAFDKNKTIKELYFPKTVKTVDLGAVWYCKALEYVYFPEGKIDIISPIVSCPNIKVIEIDSDVDTPARRKKDEIIAYYESTHFENNIHPEYLYTKYVSLEDLNIDKSKCPDVFVAAVVGFVRRYNEGYKFSDEIIASNKTTIKKSQKLLLNTCLTRAEILAYMLENSLIDEKNIAWLRKQNPDDLTVRTLLMKNNVDDNEDSLSLDNVKEKTAAELKKEWSVKETGKGLVLRAYKGYDKKVYVPEKIGKKQVIEIWTRCFGHASIARKGKMPIPDNVVLVDIPETVENIHMFAFGIMKNKITVVFHGVNTMIDEYAFENEKGLIFIAPEGSKAIKFAKKHRIKYEISEK